MAKVVIREPGTTVVAQSEEELKLVVQETPVGVTLEEATVKIVQSQVGAQGPQGPAGLTVFHTFHTWSVQGLISVPIGDTDFIPPMFISSATGQTITLVKVKHGLRTGGTVTAKLQRNGVDVPGYTGITVTTTATELDPADVTLVEGDQLALVVTGVAGGPQNMSFTVVLRHAG